MTLSKECFRKLGLITTLIIALHLGLAPTLRSDGQPALTIQTAADGTQTAVVNGKTVGTIEILKAGTRLYHWAHPRDIERWAQAGRVPGEEVAALMKNHDGMAAGGGFYASKDALDSSNFGEKLLIMEIKKDTRILNGAGAAYDLRTILGNDWDNVQRELRALNLSGMRYSSTWLNFFEESPLEKAWTPKSSVEILDAFRADSPGSKRPSFQQLLRLDQSYPLVDHPVIQKNFPELSKYLTGKALTEPEQIKLYAHLSTMPEVHSSITKKLRQFFHSRFVQEYIRSFATITKNGRISPEVDFEFDLVYAMMNGVQAKEILPSTVQHQVAPIMIGFLPNNASLTNEFARNFYESFEFIDWNDIVDSMEKGDPAPWTRYDQTGMAPLLDRWRKAKQPVGGTDPDSEVLGSYRALSGNPNGTYRDAPIIAGGDFEVNGKKYYRITESQLETLKKDLFLSVEWVDDPNPPQGAPTKTYLARHEYPSAKTYKKFQQLLSADLLKKLKQAEGSGQLANEASIEFKNLTQAVLKELILYSEKKNVSPLFRYQLQISIHPFSDYNGRSLRAKYFKDAGKPLVMKNWDLDLFLNYEEFASESAAGQLQYQALFKGLFDAEKASPDVPPKFYDIKEPYMMVSGVSELDEPPADFVNRVKAFYTDPANDELIRRKQYYDVELGLKKQCVRQALFNQFGI